MNTKGLTGRALGEAVIDHVLMYPEQHKQDAVLNECGTSACLAGHVLLLHYGLRTGTVHDSLYSMAGLPCGAGASERAADLLGVDRDDFDSAVFLDFDRDRAIANLKHLLDETFSEPAS